jgi:PAS domain S-box-containing protein
MPDSAKKITAARRFQADQVDLAHYRDAIDQHAIVSIADREGRIIHVNDRFCELSGFSREELIGANHRLLKSSQHPAEFYADLWRTITSGKTWHGEVCNRKRNGELYWVNATIMPVLDGEGKPCRYISIRTDITRLKNTEVELRESEARQRFFSDNVEEGVVVCHQGIIVDVSERWLELFQCRREEAVGQPVLSFTGQRDRKSVV